MKSDEARKSKAIETGKDALKKAAETEIGEIQKTLESEEKSAFGESAGAVKRRKFDSLSRGDKKKRVDEAVKRRKNAQDLAKLEIQTGKNDKETPDIDEAMP